MAEQVVMVESQMCNEDGMWYGLYVIVFAETFDDGMDALCEKYGEDRVYDDHDMTDQFKYTVITRYDNRESLNRENWPWVVLLDEHLDKKVGFAELRKIVDILA